MLETVREYASSSSARIGRRRARTARVQCAFVERAELKGPAQPKWLARLDTELDKLRAAVDAAAREDSDLELRLAGRLWRYWWVRGYLDEGLCEWKEARAAATTPSHGTVRMPSRGGRTRVEPWRLRSCQGVRE